MDNFTQQESPEATQAYLTGLPEYLDPRDPFVDRVRQIAPEQLRVFTLSLQDIESPEPIGRAKFAGWRFLASDFGAVVAADVMAAVNDKPVRLTSVSRDPAVGDLFRGLEAARRSPDVQNKQQRYEVTVLSIPGVLVEAYWLQSQSGAPHLFVPVVAGAKRPDSHARQNENRLELFKTYPLDEFFAIVKRAAEKFRQFDQIPHGPSKAKPGTKQKPSASA